MVWHTGRGGPTHSVCQARLPLCVGGAGGSGVGSSRDSTERAMLFGLEWRELMGELEGSDITSRESPPLTVCKEQQSMKCVGWCELVFTKTTLSTWVNSSPNTYTYVRMYVHIVKIATVQIKFSFSIAQSLLLITQYMNLLCNI